MWPVRRSGKAAFHIALALLTAGLWLPIWRCMALLVRGWKCGVCGAPVESAQEESLSPAGLRRRIAAHFARYQSLSPWAFTWRASLESLGVAIVVGLLAALVFPFHHDRLNLTAGNFFIFGVIRAPIIETLLFQVILIEVGRRLGAGFRLQIAISTVPFAAAHFLPWGPVSGFSAGLVGGFYLAFTCASWRPRSAWTAFWTTAVSHAFHNALVFLVLLLPGR